jgi:hypothetical protein
MFLLINGKKVNQLSKVLLTYDILHIIAHFAFKMKYSKKLGLFNTIMASFKLLCDFDRLACILVT